MSLYVKIKCGENPAYPTLASRKLDTLISLPTTGKKPLIVSGGGVNRSYAGPEVTELAASQNIPVCTTMTGQGTMPDDYAAAPFLE